MWWDWGRRWGGERSRLGLNARGNWRSKWYYTEKVSEARHRQARQKLKSAITTTNRNVRRPAPLTTRSRWPAEAAEVRLEWGVDSAVQGEGAAHLLR